MKRYLSLSLALCLLAGCGGKTAGVDAPVSQPPAPTPEPTEIHTPVPTPEPTEVSALTPGPSLPEEVLALLDLAETDRVMDRAAGDLNGDGLTDWAVVIERPSLAEEPGEYFTDAPRTLAILLNDGAEGYTLGQINDHFIRRDTQGACMATPTRVFS